MPSIHGRASPLPRTAQELESASKKKKKKKGKAEENGAPAKAKKGRPLDSSMNGGDAEVQDLQLSDSDDEDD